MTDEFKNKNYWAIILGGSSGLGLATAKKLAGLGLNICIVHRDRKSTLATIEQEFDQIKTKDIDFLSFNIDALKVEKRNELIDTLKEKLGTKAKVKVLIHSIAKGNLKPMISDEKPTLSVLRAKAIKKHGKITLLFLLPKPYWKPLPGTSL